MAFLQPIPSENPWIPGQFWYETIQFGVKECRADMSKVKINTQLFCLSFEVHGIIQEIWDVSELIIHYKPE